MALKNYRIKKEGRLVTVTDHNGSTVYSSTRHSVVRADRHPYISGFSKLVDFGNSYSGLLKKVQKAPSQSIRSYWENVGTYTLDVMVDNNK
ncbi:MAG: hypothetical protein LKH27_08455 [Prevotella sp.]|jgi:hypothetical protein|nr:hypothetical protein [Prevotella sp.]MCH3993383.1 hypothetical protein [Prevotella sp.]MCI1474429.1 hypothetical protein [Prevotella sp.]MCI1549077.1 hypothetical protein [Prevotella sp.]MCI1596015.1 hypothetical protein [Prevotella sp.]